MCSAWDPFRYLETEPTARHFLAERYAAAGLDNPERLAYQQSHRFMYTCIQARTYYLASAEGDLLIQPLLLFYGCVNLLKALLITREPDYPQNSRMLQHGVTTRKRKKSTYQLLQDEVRPQKEGLFPQLAHSLRLTIVQDRYTLDYLFASLPELVSDYSQSGFTSAWKPIQAIFSSPGMQLLFPHDSSGPLAYSTDTLAAYLNRVSPPNVHFYPAQEDLKSDKTDSLTQPDRQATRAIHAQGPEGVRLQQHPLLAAHSADRYLFWNGSTDQLPLPGWAAHYLLLYVLSMLCRYETEWWGELVLSRTMAEVYQVHRFLAIHRQLFPLYVYERLTGEERYFLQAPSL
ncbi:YaaC family protein [Brevibacillus humidisoli]|uniref:YaaC family protein n=1 Tax=Brevibacillus humidisoli TaxID=2895522 RepID=UPI001E5026AF|nr:YaaC family protein [Brevibacillus humidisoli]UFJ40461.1 YaaC family protein [Brevibacillus humidisoli]